MMWLLMGAILGVVGTLAVVSGFSTLQRLLESKREIRPFGSPPPGASPASRAPSVGEPAESVLPEKDAPR